MDGELRRIQSELRRIECDRDRLEDERWLLLDAEPERRADQRQLRRDLELKYIRLDHEQADLCRRERSIRVRLGSTPSSSSSSSSRSTGSAPRVRQSVLYSARRGPRGRQGRPVEEHTAEVSSSEPGNTNTDLSQFQALTLNTTPPTLESDDRVVEHPTEVRCERGGTSVKLSKVEGLSLNVPAAESTDGVGEHIAEVSSSDPTNTNMDLSQFEALTLNTTPPTLESTDRDGRERLQPFLGRHRVFCIQSQETSKQISKTAGTEFFVFSPKGPRSRSTRLAVVHASDIDSRASDSTNAKQPAVREGLSPRSQERWLRIDQYLAEHTFDDMWEGMVAMKNGFCNPPKKVPFPNKKSSKKVALPDSLQSPHGLDAQSSQTTAQCEESTEQIIENGREWMKKEVMEAFKKYMKETGRFRGVEFKLHKLLHQCLSVETYEKIFHHYNFRVKTKQAGSDKWSSTLYFAQVKEMYGRKYYFCYPLDPFEDGVCHACKNQGMDALKHPAVPIGYETGQADTGCPFFDDSSDDGDRVPDEDGMAWAFSQVFFGGAPY